jgi:hypothetical protein
MGAAIGINRRDYRGSIVITARGGFAQGDHWPGSKRAAGDLLIHRPGQEPE